MADVEPRNVTHCRKCRCNRYGDNCRCLVCNSTEVHTFQVYVCLACNREYDSEDSAYECCPSEEDDEQGELVCPESCEHQRVTRICDPESCEHRVAQSCAG